MRREMMGFYAFVLIVSLLLGVVAYALTESVYRGITLTITAFLMVRFIVWATDDE